MSAMRLPFDPRTFSDIQARTLQKVAQIVVAKFDPADFATLKETNYEDYRERQTSQLSSTQRSPSTA